ncbi:Catabolite control protein A [Chryseobacterium sp. MOF25P]|uniref:LacI family DNA-binding transcriptional regulator n=1 Tax=unclassified Chryseobacterium TaxID=2593645 RepID=UPI00080543B0|nr:MULTISPECIES: LacI family DNA-binding transcriptional regulator [unclassified Chryseobacterium]OBW41917.1 Catabolite control protein A [Chryseobacterium sp. MOF25P]OBW45076.1 Catabolite control protein A [Chryseobacterium sp. BGARF1]
MKRASIKDIARIAGVSVATVSYVLNKKEGNRISEDTKKKIFEVAETLNYTPNRIARSLQNNKSKLLGLIVADISNDFYSSIARNLEDKALKLGYTLIIGSSDENAEKFEKLIDLFSQQQVDGMIIAPVAGSEEVLQKLLDRNYPLVTIDRYLKGVNAPGVILNNREIAETTTQFLIDKEFDEIVYVGYETKLQHLLDRQKGFETSIKDSGTNSKAKYITVGLENISGEIHAEMEKTLGKNPTNSALYFSSNKLAVAGLEYLIKNNIKVPQQVFVLAFDETEAYKLFPAEITYIKQPLEEMADEAIKLLDLQISDYAATSKKITLSGELIIKKSIK